MNWDDWRVFHVLSELGSLGKAAKALGVDHSTVSRRLASLEEALGTQLAQRNPNGLELTAAGEAVAAAGASMKDLVAEVARRVGGEDERAEGVVRISSTPGFAPFILRGLSKLRERYPKIQVDVLARVATLDLARREADIAVRMFRPERGALIAKKLGNVGWSLYASEEYLSQRKHTIGSPSLEGHEVIGYDESVASMPGAQWLHERLGDTVPIMSCGDPTSVRSAILTGLGVSTLPCALTEGEPRLRRLTPDILASSEVFLVIPADHKNTVRIRVTVDHLVEQFAEHADMLEGRANPTAG